MNENEVILSTLLGALQGPQSYSDRMIDRMEADWGFISTAHTSDAMIETAVCHNEYMDDDGSRSPCIVVENYENVADALLGHAKWCKTMTDNPPDEIVDIGKSPIALLCQEKGLQLRARRL